MKKLISLFTIFALSFSILYAQSEQIERPYSFGLKNISQSVDVQKTNPHPYAPVSVLALTTTLPTLAAPTSRLTAANCGAQNTSPKALL